MLTPQQLATIRAALRYWQEEMCPHGESAMRPYLPANRREPLTGQEVAQLSRAFAPAAVRYALCRRRPSRLISTELFATVEEALQTATRQDAIATLLLPRGGTQAP